MSMSPDLKTPRERVSGGASAFFSLLGGSFLDATMMPSQFWAEVADAACYYELMPWVLSRILNAERLPKGPYKIFCQAHRQNALAVLTLDLAIKEIVETFCTIGVPLAILVGIPFAEAFFEGKEHRLADDVDLLILGRDFDCVRNILESLGFRKTGPPPSFFRKHQAFIRGAKDLSVPTWKGRVLVKVYRSLTLPAYFHIDTGEFLKKVVTRNGTPVLDDNAAMAHLLLHAHLYDCHLKVLVDIDRLAKLGFINWLDVQDLLDSGGARALGTTIAGVVVRLLDSPIPTTFLSSFPPAEKMGNPIWWCETFPNLGPDRMTCIGLEMIQQPYWQEVFLKQVEQTGCRRVSSPAGRCFFKRGHYDQPD